MESSKPASPGLYLILFAPRVALSSRRRETDHLSSGHGASSRRFRPGAVTCEHAASGFGHAAALAGLIGASTVANEAWIDRHRINLPFDIDEAGYLQRAVRDSGVLAHSGLGGAWSVLRIPDPQAPVLPLTGGFVRWVTGVGPYGLIVTQQFFVAVLLVATYICARNLTTRNWSLLASVLVAAVPAIVNEGRSFHFGLAAAALTTSALAAQLHAGDFSRVGRSIAWGALLGLASLTRSMMLALLPLLVLAGAVRVLQRRNARSAAHFSVALLFGAGVSYIWYSATWSLVWRYLTKYGYGSKASGYGTGHTPFSPGWWTFRFDLLLHTEMFAPIVAAVAVCLLARGPVAIRSLRHRSSLRGAPRRVTEGPGFTVLIFVAGSYLVLSSTRNAGLDFELSIIPAIIVLAVSAASRASARLARAAAASITALAGLSYAGTSGLLDSVAGPVANVATSAVSVPLWDGRGPLLDYVAPSVASCPEQVCHGATTGLGVRRYLAAWPAASQSTAHALYSIAAASGYRPVVFFAQQDRLFNTNTVDLDFQLDYHAELPTGLLDDPSDAKESLLDQLDDPKRGQPNLVITGPPATGAANFSPLHDDVSGLAALASAGFAPVAHVVLPDGRAMTFWWKARGPRAPVIARYSR
jgi:4-amino-4-deoxy-L-arabinose transferase-like glycosyltransferase